MTARTPKPLGTIIDVPPGTVIRRPDDSEVTVSHGGTYALDLVGVHLIGDRKQEVTEAETPDPAPSES